MDGLLSKLIRAFGVSGHEEVVRNTIIEELGKLHIDYTLDKMGNLIVALNRNEEGKQNSKRYMFTAHMDSIGMICTYIDSKGFCRMGALGGFKPANMVNNFVQFENGILGRIGIEKDGGDIEDLFVDIGVNNRETALEKIKEGHVASINGYVLENKDFLIGPNLDNRVGCYILLKTIERIVENKELLSNLNKELYFVFTAQNNLGGRGARAAAYAIEPEYCIVVDMEGTKDCIGAKGKLELSKGPAIKIMDRTLIMHHEIKEIIEEAANKMGLDINHFVGEDASEGGTIHKEIDGVKTGTLCIPCRYLNTNEEMVSFKDIELTKELLFSML